jgi:hypothetical protein
MLSAVPAETAEGTGQSGQWCSNHTVHAKSPRAYFVAINTMCSHVTSTPVHGDRGMLCNVVYCALTGLLA